MPSENIMRVGAFFGVAGLLVIWEILAPRLSRPSLRVLRWPGNLGLVLISTVLIRLIFPVLPVGLAVWVVGHGLGLISLLPLPEILAGLLGIALLDLGIYGQHVASHHFRWFWRLHRVHHADTVLDLTTALRFHPLEMLLSLAYKLVLVLVLGSPVWAVLVFEILLNALPMFNHANIRLPGDAWVRRAVVTPDMHRVHHSVTPGETNSNFGFCFPWWDLFFKTYRAQPVLGHEGMTVGLGIFRERPWMRLWGLLRMPFCQGR